jgi:hypothetical protein
MAQRLLLPTVGAAPGELPGRGPEVLAEPPRQVRLVGEPDFGRDIGERLAPEDPIAGRLHAPPEDVALGGDPVSRGEHAGEPRGSCTDLLARGPQGHRFRQVGIQERPQLLGQVAAVQWRNGRGCLAERRADPLRDAFDPGLRLQAVLDAGEQVVKRRDLAAQRGVGDDQPGKVERRRVIEGSRTAGRESDHGVARRLMA